VIVHQVGAVVNGGSPLLAGRDRCCRIELRRSAP